MTPLILALALTAPAQTLEFVQSDQRPDLWYVYGEGYRDRWVTVSIYKDGQPWSWHNWKPSKKHYYGEAGEINVPFFGVTTGTYTINVRKGYQYSFDVGKLIISRVFVVP